MSLYTETKHALRLLVLLNKKDSCSKCPASRKFRSYNHPSVRWDYMVSKDVAYPCNICKNFLGFVNGCPCNELGETKAIKLTWITLEKKGYLDLIENALKRNKHVKDVTKGRS